MTLAFGLAACSKPASEAAPPAPLDAASTASATVVTPSPSDSPASSNANGPADGATAIGGMSAHPANEGVASDASHAPTAGDGSASAPN